MRGQSSARALTVSSKLSATIVKTAIGEFPQTELAKFAHRGASAFKK
jgi:hypothetical protein